MLKINEIKVGDYFIAENEGDQKLGAVSDINLVSNQVCINAGVPNLWYNITQIKPLPLNEKAMTNLKFTKQINHDGTVKFSKGAFRVLIPKEGDFSKMEIWYRDEHRHIKNPIFIHELQNHFKSMTNIVLSNIAY